MIVFDKNYKPLVFSKKARQEVMMVAEDLKDKQNKKQAFRDGLKTASLAFGLPVAVRVGSHYIDKGIEKTINSIREKLKKSKAKKAEKAKQEKPKGFSEVRPMLAFDKNNKLVVFSGFQKKYEKALREGNYGAAAYLERRRKPAVETRKEAQKKGGKYFDDTYADKIKWKLGKEGINLSPYAAPKGTPEKQISEGKKNAIKTARTGVARDIAEEKTEKKINDVKAKVKGAAEKTKEVANTAKNITRGFLDKTKKDTVSTAKNIAEGTTKAGKNIWDLIKKGTKATKEGATNIFGKVKDSAKKAGEGIKTGLDNYITDIKNEASKYNKK